MDEIEEAKDGIDYNKLLFIGSNREKFNVNTCKIPLNFLSAIHNGNISLKEAKFKQRDIEKKIEDLRCYRNNAEEEKEETNGVLMQANDLLEYINKTIDVFKDGTFLSEHLKKIDDAAYDYVLKDVNSFIKKIESISEKINLSFLKDFFESSSLADYAKMLINTKKPDKNKKFVALIKDRISNVKDRIKKWFEQKKK